MSTAGQGALARTLRTLAREPGAVTRARLQGTAAGFVPPGRVLAGFVALVLALTIVQARATPGPRADVARACADSTRQSLRTLVMMADRNQGLMPDVSTQVQRERVIAVAAQMTCDPGRVERAFSLGAALGFLLLMPLSAALMSLAFRSQAPRWRDHWEYGVEAHATLFGLLAALAALGLLGLTAVNLLASLAGLIYASWSVVRGVQRAFGVSARAALWRSTLAGIVYAPALAVATLVLMWVQLR